MNEIQRYAEFASNADAIGHFGQLVKNRATDGTNINRWKHREVLPMLPELRDIWAAANRGEQWTDRLANWATRAKTHINVAHYARFVIAGRTGLTTTRDIRI